MKLLLPQSCLEHRLLSNSIWNAVSCVLCQTENNLTIHNHSQKFLFQYAAMEHDCICRLVWASLTIWFFHSFYLEKQATVSLSIFNIMYLVICFHSFKKWTGATFPCGCCGFISYFCKQNTNFTLLLVSLVGLRPSWSHFSPRKRPKLKKMNFFFSSSEEKEAWYSALTK